MKAVISLSGGLDSAVLLGFLRSQPVRSLTAVSFFYGSKHNLEENKAASLVASYYNAQFRLINLEGVIDPFHRSALMCGTEGVPRGHYEEDSMRQTIVPGRNLIFAALLAGIAESDGAGEVYIGVHAGDHFIYPDCRPEFFEALGRTISIGSDNKVTVKTPFEKFNKTEIVKLGLQLGVPFYYTRTCYNGEKLACGVCGSCQERLEAFHNNDTEDPIGYVTRELIPKQQ